MKLFKCFKYSRVHRRQCSAGCEAKHVLDVRGPFEQLQPRDSKKHRSGERTTVEGGEREGELLCDAQWDTSAGRARHAAYVEAGGGGGGGGVGWGGARSHRRVLQLEEASPFSWGFFRNSSSACESTASTSSPSSMRSPPLTSSFTTSFAP